MMSNGPALAILNGDSGSSKPSDRSVSPPSTDGPSELSATPPTRNGITPSPPGVHEIDFERETKVKYRRSSIVPDYRHSMFPTESLPNGIGHANGNGNGAVTNGTSTAPSTSKNSPPRKSSTTTYPNGNTFASPRPSDLSSRPRRSVSPDSTRRQTTMGLPASSRPTNGAVSPLTVRSVSPVGWRSGNVSPIAARSSSPVRAASQYRASPLSTGNGNGNSSTSTPGIQTPAQAQALAAHKLAARHTMVGLTLNTQMTVPAARPRPQSTTQQQPPDDPSAAAAGAAGGGPANEDEMDEVISLSPAVRMPVMRFKRQSTLGSAIGSPGPEGSSMTLDTVLENGESGGGDVKRYFGQDVNAEDLVAVNLENAFDQL
ncbi:uncharacterized protein LTR77_006015 [Saxophila tyrrhenica]|uniref:Uncharacterized protein n=1 Tax=Saxophila tyrrhenica TaxID=1690608 RepID=A0AAV9P6N8_9PEZI|nr:hypothetical protein LTR77_006015 [Saxophila tyrrhenica]